MHEDKDCMMVKLSVIDQSVFCAFDETIIYPVPGGWGRQGATMINLKKVKKGNVPGCIDHGMENGGAAKAGNKIFPRSIVGFALILTNSFFTDMKKFLFVFCMASLTAKAQIHDWFIPTLDSVFNSFFKSGEPGGAVLLAQGNNVFYQRGFGIADINTKEPITTKTLFNIGSISKTFVAYGILDLVQKKKLSLEDDLSKVFS